MFDEVMMAGLPTKEITTYTPIDVKWIVEETRKSTWLNALHHIRSRAERAQEVDELIRFIDDEIRGAK